MKKKDILLGVLGGLGPMSTFYFCELLTAHTSARRDSDHVDMLVSSRASTPDRTAFILGNSTENPLPSMIEEAIRLERAGVDLIVIPCNTAHFFYDELAKAVSIPVLNIISETVNFLAHKGIHRMGLLATEGTVRSRSYHRLCEAAGIVCLTPNDKEQAEISRIIYEAVKQNKEPDFASFFRVSSSLLDRGCECLVLGCTELSLLKKAGLMQPWYVDSLEVLANRTLRLCGKAPVGFSEDLMAWEDAT